ncbi:MAG: NUDIX domain-containing protein [Candidatus Sungbacteria bacterium]|nr:NUDIX domain-containing protein [Candidatus Sungbacteria bacterium]
MMDPFLHQVVITAIVVKDEKFLLERRAVTKPRFPGKWTVPGGKLDVSDYATLPKDSADYWYNVLERTLRREVREEVGIEIRDIRYVTSLATIHADGTASLVISCLAHYAGGEIVIQPEELDKAEWMTLEEAKAQDLIDGIYDELCMADEKLKGTPLGEWKRA